MDVKELYSLVDKARKYDELIKPFKDKQLHCSFCGKSQDQVNTLIAGVGVYICNECVELSHDILLNSSKTEKRNHKTCKGCKYNQGKGCKYNQGNGCTNPNLCVKDYYGYYSGYEEI